MGDFAADVLFKYWTAKDIETAIGKVLTDLKHDREVLESWRVLYQLLCSTNVEFAFNTKDLVALCLDYIKQSEAKGHLILVAKVLVSVIEKGNLSDVKDDLSRFLLDVQTSIICQSDTNQQHDGYLLDYETSTSVLSEILPASIKAGLLFDNTASTSLKVVQAMIESRNEKSIVRAAGFVQGTLSSMDAESLHLVFQSIRTLFHPEDNIGTSKIIGNHPGLTALCSLADVLFSDNVLTGQASWFLECVHRFVFNPVTLNRKRGQYLLKRYVDFTGASNSKNAVMFNDFFIILETLEEKQFHIIKPVLVKLEAWQEAVLIGGALDPSWLLSLYGRILSHENAHVVKWGLHHLCCLPLERWIGFGRDEYWLYDLFLAGLNNLCYYARDSADQLPALGQDLVRLINKVATLPDERDGFFFNILKRMSSVSWNCVGLFHLVFALASVSAESGAAVLDGQALRIVLEFLRGGLHTHHPLVRGAVQALLFEFVLNMTTVHPDSLRWVVLILATLGPTYVRSSPLLGRLVDWIRRNFTPAQHGDLLSQLLDNHFQKEVAGDYSVDVLAVARYVVLLVDADSVHPEALLKLQRTLETIDGCETRLYADQTLLEWKLKLLVTLLDECGGATGNHLIVRECVDPLAESAIQYCLNRIEVLADYQSLCDQLSVLGSFARAKGSAGFSAGRRIESIARRCLEGPTALDRFKSVSLMSIASAMDPSSSWIDELFQQVLRLKMHCNPPKRDVSLTDESQVTWGAFMSHYFSELWALLERRLAGGLKTETTSEEFAEESIAAVDVAGVEAVQSIMRCLARLLPSVVKSSSSGLVRRILEQCWSLCYDHRRSDHFWSLMDLFARMAFQPELMEDPELRPILFDTYLAELKRQGENIASLFNLAVQQIVDVWTTPGKFLTVDQHSVRFLVDAITFGLVKRRDEMVKYETFAFVRSLGDRCPANLAIQNNSEDVADGQVRFQGLRFILSLRPDDANHMAMASRLLDALLAEDRVSSTSKARHFSSSYGHRFKHRLWVAVLILQDLGIPGSGEEIMKAALNGLSEDNPQPSVRFLQEWSVVRAICENQRLEQEFWKVMDKAVGQRAGAMVSFLSIACHAARALGRQSERLEPFVVQALPRVIPWAMAQHFTPRLYAIVVLDGIWDICSSQLGKSGSSLLDRYSTVRLMLQSTPEMPNCQKNTEKLAADFYFSVFHPLDHFTLETLCHQLPRLSHLAADEWIPAEWFEGLAVPSRVPVRNPDGGKLAECSPAEWVARAAGGTPAFLGTVDDPADPSAIGMNVQKKITPWKQMLPDVDSLAASAGRKNIKSQNDLIVIASLIDRIPNLGGLCRTCEVLGARAFALASLSTTEEKDFISLSVSAHKWMNVIEVKPFHLVNFIDQLKLEGYSVVGAEQTASSKPLNQFTFPRKTALILGHEKEGIPVELIQHLDHCVEVPQEGIIRSMNVHVTGAIFIWEYVRQQLDLPSL